MKHETRNFTIKNVVLLSTANAQKPCNKSEEFKLYKIWVAAKKDILRKVLDDAFRPNEIDNQDVFEFCEVTPATGKVQRALRLCEYDNPEDYVTFEIISWNKPFECSKVKDFNDLQMQEFTLTCYIGFKQVSIKDDEGNFKIDQRGQYLKKDAGCFNASNTFMIDDLDIDETFDE